MRVTPSFDRVRAGRAATRGRSGAAAALPCERAACTFETNESRLDLQVSMLSVRLAAVLRAPSLLAERTMARTPASSVASGRRASRLARRAAVVGAVNPRSRGTPCSAGGTTSGTLPRIGTVLCYHMPMATGSSSISLYFYIYQQHRGCATAVSDSTSEVVRHDTAGGHCTVRIAL